MALTDKLTAVADAIRTKRGTTGTYTLAQMPAAILGITGTELPSGISAIAYGKHTLASDSSYSTGFTVTHNLGAVPNMFLFYTSTNISKTQSMLFTIYSTINLVKAPILGILSSSYPTLSVYHTTSTSALVASTTGAAYGINSVTATTVTVKAHSLATLYWRAGTYNWIAIKFG